MVHNYSQKYQGLLYYFCQVFVAAAVAIHGVDQNIGQRHRARCDSKTQNSIIIEHNLPGPTRTCVILYHIYFTYSYNILCYSLSLHVLLASQAACWYILMLTRPMDHVGNKLLAFFISQLIQCMCAISYLHLVHIYIQFINKSFGTCHLRLVVQRK